MSSDYKKKFTDLIQFLPESYRSTANTSFIQNLHNKFLTKEETSKVIGYIGDGVETPTEPYVPNINVDRAVNTLLPTVVAKSGTQHHVFTFTDTLTKLKMIGVDTTDFMQWGSAVGFNFAPPIALDKFVNYSRYRWYGHLLDIEAPVYNKNFDPEYYVIEKTGVSDWARSNFWVHEDDANAYFESKGFAFTIDSTVAAKRPIVEYYAALEAEMRIRVANGKPSAEGTLVDQTIKGFKTEFNQKPLFNLYLHNGDHSGVVSPIFYFTEGNNYQIDAAMKQRIAVDKYGDFTFSQGLVSKDLKRILFYKNKGTLSTIWKKGAIEQPKFVKIVDGREVAADPKDEANTNVNSSWKTPAQMQFNILHENRKSIAYSDLIGHFISIMKAQDKFSGNPFGANNFRTLTKVNLGLGGTIKDYSTDFALFLGLTNQIDSSIPGVIEFGKTQYAQLLGSIEEFATRSLGIALTEGMLDGAITELTNNVDPALAEFYKKFLSYVSSRNDASVFSDTTSSINGWPATIPYLGLGDVYQPSIYFDRVLGSLVLRHHDGHVSPISTTDVDFEKALANLSFVRSNGLSVAGVVGHIKPARPYKNQLWFDLATDKLKMFSVISDTNKVFNQEVLDGSRVYVRDTNEMFKYNALTLDYDKVDDVNSAWIEVNTQTILNQLLLMAETQLYANCPPKIKRYDISAVLNKAPEKALKLLEAEMAIFAAKRSLDISASNYTPTNAFSWNYKNVTVAGKSYARWFSLYEAIFGTQRPDLEPWVLQGYTEKPYWWNELFLDTTTSKWKSNMWAMIKANSIPGKPAPNGKSWSKVSVDKATGELLPPYVSPTDARSIEALLTEIPPDISDGYKFGEMGPAEMLWRTSVDCLYDKLKVCFKLDPIKFITDTWGNNTIEVGGYPIDRQSHRRMNHKELILHGEAPNEKFTSFSVSNIKSYSEDTEWVVECVSNTKTGGVFVVTGNVSGRLPRFCLNDTPFIHNRITFTISDHGSDFNIGDRVIISMPSEELSFESSKYAKFAGLNQWFVHLNRYNSVDMQVTVGNSILREWDMKLGYRASGLLDTNLLELKTDRFSIGKTDYEVIIKENAAVKDYWLDALRIQLIRVGTTQFDGVKNVPKDRGFDWQFRVETFNPAHPEITYYEYKEDSKVLTFNAMSGAKTSEEWRRKKEVKQTVKKLTPFVIKGIDNVVDFLFGYSDYLNDCGWRFNVGTESFIDVSTSRSIDWQYFIEKFIDAQYGGIEAGTGAILNPFSMGVWFDTPRGVVANMRDYRTSDITTTQTIYDSFGANIYSKDLQIFRNDDRTEIQSAVVMGGIHLMVNEYEHFILFNDYTYDQSRKKLVYDAFLGARVNRMHISTTRQLEFTGRLSYGGHYILGTEVKRNIESSVSDVLNYYDSSRMVDETKTADHARGLLGYDSKKYMTELGLAGTAQFGFWKGMINNKGSNFSVDAFLNSARFESAKIDEYWAYKIAEFGDARKVEYPEIKLSSADAQHLYTKINFSDSNTLNGYLNVKTVDEARWVDHDDYRKPLAFEAEMIGQLEFVATGTSSILVVDLVQNGKQIIADAVQVFAEVYAPTGDRKPFLVPIDNEELINSSTVRVDMSKLNIDMSKYILGAPPKFVVKCYGPSQAKFNPVKLIDYKNRVVIQDLPIWDPARGSHAPEALEIVDMISDVDPAKYNYSVRQVGNVNYDFYRPWDHNDVGRVWWNTKNMSYIPYSDTKLFPQLDARLSYWGSLAEWSSVELYEWVESKVHPKDYAELAASEEGNTAIPADIRASGEPAMPELYARKRTWRQRPIAWAYTDTPGTVEPYMQSVGEYSVTFQTQQDGSYVAILSTNTWLEAFEDLSIGTKISGGVFRYNTLDVADRDNFKLIKPYGEAVITGLNQDLVIGSSKSVTNYVIEAPTYSYNV